MKVQDLFEATKPKIKKGNTKIKSIKNGQTDLQGLCSEINQGDVEINKLGLTSLNGAPREVTRNFSCEDNKLTTLEGAPVTVGDDFSCYGNEITSLKGCPSTVPGYFNCANNLLTSLKDGPTSAGGYSCGNNLLTSLKGAPSSVKSVFLCTDNRLTSLEGVPSSIGDMLAFNNNQITTLAGIHKQIKEVDWITAYGNPIKSHMLGVLLIKNLRGISWDGNDQVAVILNKYLPNENGMDAVLDCQEELIEAGFEEYAQL